jgi:N-acetylneuraminic acid mutarotase
MSCYRRLFSCFSLLSITILLSSCGGTDNNGDTNTTPPAVHNEWTWVTGSSTPAAVNSGQGGVYGTQGVAAATNTPGSREGATSWSDSSGNFWLFGGYGYSAQGSFPGSAGMGYLNDLWKFNPTANTWTWIAGANNTSGNHGSTGIYGTEGVAAPSNVPGGRWDAIGWTDTHGILWMFGGGGFDSVGADGNLNDLWSFNPSTNQWTWVSGSSTKQQGGSYGSPGVAASTNVPGGRGQGVAWTGSDGNLWLFGGIGLDGNGGGGVLNDLWTYNPTSNQWTWVGGSKSAVGQQGIYGTQGQASTSNVPGGRRSALGWVDGSGKLWLFGGMGFDSTGDLQGLLNDLWMYDPTTKSWTWVTGSKTSGAAATYGAIGVGAIGNTPEANDGAISWTDSQHNFWLFGGGTNALWKFTPANSTWTWVSGTNQIGSVPTYGNLGVPSPGNMPGARASAVGWVDSSSQLWLFGGNGIETAGGYQDLNDLWKYQP